MARYAFSRQADPTARHQWKTLHLVTDGKVTTLDMIPALWGGWQVRRVSESSPDDWPGMDAARIATWVRDNWSLHDSNLVEIDPATWDEVHCAYLRRTKDC